MTGFPFESRTMPCSAAFLGALWQGNLCCATDCWSGLGTIAAFALAPGEGTAHNKLTSQHRHTDFESNTRDGSRIASDPGCPVSFGDKQLESPGDHSIFRKRQISCNGSEGTIWVPIFALFNHDCTTDLQNH